MPFDGLFLHHLIDELKVIENSKIYKINSITENEYQFVLSNKNSLYISSNPSFPHLRLTKEKFMSSNTNLSLFFKKHIEGGIIKKIYQKDNDRIALIDITSFNDLGYEKQYTIVIELMGKFTNLIILDNEGMIVEAGKKTYLTDMHPIQVKLKYEYPESNKINPFTIDNNDFNINNLEGIAKIVSEEIKSYGLNEVITRETDPIIYKTNDKYIFYCFKLNSLIGEKMHFNNLSEMLEYFYTTINQNKQKSIDEKNTIKYIEKEISKLTLKKEKQLIELEAAKNYKEIELKANLLLSSINKVKKGMTEIIVNNYFSIDNEPITIAINPNISINENINFYFNKVKKAKRTIEILSTTIKDTDNDILYYNDLLSQIDHVTQSDLKELMIEIGLKKEGIKTKKPHILKYIDKRGNIIFVGKNNTQNNYLTHTLAHKDDYFFHVKNIPGSHVILRGILDNESIKLASNIAAYYSKAQNSKSVCVDYTLVKWVKKVKGTKGSFVIYTNEKNAWADPDINEIMKEIERTE